MWIHPVWENRSTKREFATLYQLLIDDEPKFQEYFKMSMYSFIRGL